MKRIDTLLEDEAVIETVASALEERWPKSRTRGRAGTPAEVVLRMLILKHLHDWRFDELEQEVRANAVLLTLTNVAFNLYPVLHQRYKRARARRACAPGNTRSPRVRPRHQPPKGRGLFPTV